jgi:hypothetical protein
MAIRYSGDVEVRLAHTNGTVFRVTIRTPKGRWTTDVDIGGRRIYKASPDDYDRVALVILKTCDKKHPGTFPFERDASGAVTMRRIFQAPCPAR